MIDKAPVDNGRESPFTLADVHLAHRLDIGPLVRPQPCHGYANGCICPECADREDAEQRRTAKPDASSGPRQPWVPVFREAA
jgi:hypothetical protein